MPAPSPTAQERTVEPKAKPPPKRRRNSPPSKNKKGKAPVTQCSESPLSTSDVDQGLYFLFVLSSFFPYISQIPTLARTAPFPATLATQTWISSRVALVLGKTSATATPPPSPLLRPKKDTRRHCISLRRVLREPRPLCAWPSYAGCRRRIGWTFFGRLYAGRCDWLVTVLYLRHKIEHASFMSFSLTRDPLPLSQSRKSTWWNLPQKSTARRLYSHTKFRSV